MAGFIVTVATLFASGWAVTADHFARSIHDTRVRQLAGLCAAEARERWLQSGRSPAGIRGYGHSAARRELVGETVAGWAIPDRFRRDTIEACNAALF